MRVEAYGANWFMIEGHVLPANSVEYDKVEPFEESGYAINLPIENGATLWLYIYEDESTLLHVELPDGRFAMERDGKLVPPSKGATTPEQRLLNVIFGEVRDRPKTLNELLDAWHKYGSMPVEL